MVHPKKLFAVHNLRPKKGLGQNFLFDDNVLDKIVAAANLTADDEVLEIGPGLGHLTEKIAQTAVNVVAVELDDRLLPILDAQFGHHENVTLIHGDILDQNPMALFQRPYHVIANVPYYITGAILRHLLTAAVKPAQMILTMQKEVAERLTAVPPKMSLLAVSVQFYGKVELVTTIKAGAFWPRPDVDSAVVRIKLDGKPLLPLAEEKSFFRIVKVGFSQKRKQLQKNMRQLGFPRADIAAILNQANIDGKRRAETLTIDEWVRLYQGIIKR